MTEYRTVPVPATKEMLEAMVKSREGNAVYKVLTNIALRELETEASEDFNAAISAAPELAGLQAKVRALEEREQDLAMMVRKLVGALNTTQHNHDYDPGFITAKAMDYLKRHNLQGAILREEKHD